MANETFGIRSNTGLEIKPVMNGWVVFFGTSHDENFQGVRRPEYVFQDASELADAVKALLTTGQYTKSSLRCPLVAREELQEGFSPT